MGCARRIIIRRRKPNSKIFSPQSKEVLKTTPIKSKPKVATPKPKPKNVVRPNPDVSIPKPKPKNIVRPKPDVPMSKLLPKEKAKPKLPEVPRSKIRALDLKMLCANFAQCNTGVNYDVEMARPLSCECDDTHKCWFVARANVSNIDINRIVERLFARTQENKDQILKYCFHRLLVRSTLTKPENWTITITPGKYGESIGEVLLNPMVAAVIIDNLGKLLEHNDLGRVLSVLKNEYDSLDLSQIATCRLETVLINDLIPALYPIQLLPETLQRYNGYGLPTCVCLKSGGKYRVLDGFKRLTIAQQNGKTEVSVIVLE